LRGDKVIEGDAINQLVGLPSTALSAGVHTEWALEAAASMSVAVTWRSVAVGVEP
jgi:hypothetical protein